jgi:hypothetical protein
MEFLNHEDETWVFATYEKNRTEFCQAEKARIEQSLCTLDEYKDKFEDMLRERVYRLLEPRFEAYEDELDFNPAESVIEYMWDAELEHALLFYLRTKQWQLTPSEKADDDMRSAWRVDLDERKKMWTGAMVMLRGNLPTEIRRLVFENFVEIDEWEAFNYE